MDANCGSTSSYEEAIDRTKLVAVDRMNLDKQAKNLGLVRWLLEHLQRTSETDGGQWWVYNVRQVPATGQITS